MNVARKLRRWKQADSGPLREMDAACFPTDTSFWNDDRYHWWRIGNKAYAGLRIEKEKVRSEKRGEDPKIIEVEIARFTRCGVMPDARGQGLQKVLIQARLVWCKRRGIKVVKTYTSTDNHASAASLVACGFRKRKSRDGKWFYFQKELV
jgi:GNAT superfamily N-acetyltransferase